MRKLSHFTGPRWDSLIDRCVNNPSTCHRRSTMMWIIDDDAHCTIGSAVESSISGVSAAPSTMVFHVIAID